MSAIPMYVNVEISKALTKIDRKRGDIHKNDSINDKHRAPDNRMPNPKRRYLIICR